MKRLPQVALVASFFAFSWLAMQVVHELGHVLAALVTGGDIEAVVLHPLRISQTDVLPNPHPIVEIWAGPLVGAILPALLLVIWRAGKLGRAYLMEFLAGFCLIANGIYLGLGAVKEVGDPEELILYGASRWPMYFFGVVCVPCGLYLWHRASPSFGFGDRRGQVDGRDVTISVMALALLIAGELFCNAVV